MSQLVDAQGVPFDLPPAPMGVDGKPKKRFEVRLNLVGGGLQKEVYIDGEKLDWSIDIASFVDAHRMGLKYKLEIQKSIAQHFTKSVGEVLGRFVSIAEIKNAIQTGWI
jgi:hypothetical protein